MVQIDAHYADPRLAAIYDAGSGWGVDRAFYLALAGERPMRVLDLGCGTGLICDAYAAKGHEVTGADPAESVLAVAREKPHGARVEWVLSPAQSFLSEKRFDLIIMTGHAFQVLLEEEDLRACFSVMRQHLAPGGRVVFESRNPDIDWEARWNQDEEWREVSVRYQRRTKSRQGNRITFDTIYHLADVSLVSHSELRFWTHQEITRLLTEAGLSVEHFFGDWDRSAFIPESSEEMIYVLTA